MVGKEISKYDETTDFGNTFQNLTTNQMVGDIDNGTKKYLIECKVSISPGSLDKDFLEQFFKYCDPNHSNYINVYNKKVILAVKEFKNGAGPNHPVIKQLIRKFNVTVITDLNTLKKLK